MKKKILIVYPITLVPTVMMSQRRAISQILALSEDHDVSVYSFCRTQNDILKSMSFFNTNKIKFYYAPALIKDKRPLLNKILSIKSLIHNILFANRTIYTLLSSAIAIKSIMRLINDRSFDIVISHYWYCSFYFNQIRKKIFKIIDTHVLVEEDIMLNFNGFYYSTNKKHEKKLHKMNLIKQQAVFKNSDLLILNSKKTFNLAQESYSDSKLIYCPNGQNLDHFIKANKKEYNPNLILFYGSMGGGQNIRAFKLFFENVWPLIVNKNNKAELLIVGNKPPQWIKDLSEQHNNITVTGFVEDVRDYIPKACCMVILMDIGIGFRGRIVEVMALGVPVVGNHNALDSIGMKNNEEGFISDNYNEIAAKVIELMFDADIRKKISNYGVKFVVKHYSLEATFGKLSKVLGDLN